MATTSWGADLRGRIQGEVSAQGVQRGRQQQRQQHHHHQHQHQQQQQFKTCNSRVAVTYEDIVSNTTSVSYGTINRISYVPCTSACCASSPEEPTGATRHTERWVIQCEWWDTLADTQGIRLATPVSQRSDLLELGRKFGVIIPPSYWQLRYALPQNVAIVHLHHVYHAPLLP